MRNAREHVKAPGGAADGLGDQLAGDARERDAVAGEALQEINVGRESAEVRRTVERDIDFAAPGVLDPHVAQLRKHGEHARACGGGRIEGAQPRVVHAAAE